MELGNLEKYGLSLGCRERLRRDDFQRRAVGHDFVLVIDAALADQTSPPEGLAIVSTQNAPDVQDHLARFSTKAALLRPDRFILGTAETAEELAALLRQVSRNKQ